jgi:hypothetical protein
MGELVMRALDRYEANHKKVNPSLIKRGKK